MRVLLTGADGYIGAIMGPKLIEAGHDVTGSTPASTAAAGSSTTGAPTPRSSPRTSARSPSRTSRGFDAVVHLAELSNDPIGENDPELTMEINHQGSVALAAQGAGGGRQALRPGLLLLDLRRGRRRDAHRDERARAADRLRPLQDPGRGGGARADGRALHPGLHAQRHRLRREPAAALRPGAEQPLRLRPHHARDPHDLRRLALAADHPHRGHLPAMLCALEPTRRRWRARPSTSAPTAENSAFARSPRSGEDLPGCALTIGESGGDTRSYRVTFARSAGACRSSRPPGPPSAAPASSGRSSSASGSPASCLRRAPYTRLKELKHLRDTGPDRPRAATGTPWPRCPKPSRTETAT